MSSGALRRALGVGALVVSIGLLAACGGSSIADPGAAGEVATASALSTPTGLPPDFLLFAACSALSRINNADAYTGATSATSVLTTSDVINGLRLADNSGPGFGAPGGTPRLTLPSVPHLVVTQVEGDFSVPAGLRPSGATAFWPPAHFTTQLVFSTPDGRVLERPGKPSGVPYDQLAESIPQFTSLGKVTRTTPTACLQQFGPMPTGT